MKRLIDKDWETVISKFKNLGGIAENICQKLGENGRGIFPQDPTKKSKIFIPKHLLIKRKDVYLDKGYMRINSNTDYSEEVVEFFHFYQDNFSWGGGGKEIEEFFENGLKAFPLKLKELLRQLGLIDLFTRYQCSWDDLIFESYLSKRTFIYNDNKLIVPFFELINYLPDSLPLSFSDKGIKHPDIEVSGKEITHHYYYESPLARFLSLGFTCRDVMVFSIPFNLKLKGTDLIIKCKGKSLDENDITFVNENNQIIISGFPIANIDYKELPINYLLQLSNLLTIKFDIRAFLLEVIDYNIKARKDILSKIDSIHNYPCNILIDAVSIELDIIYECINKQ